MRIDAGRSNDDSKPDDGGCRDVRYAAYGSNLHPLRLAERIASARLFGTAFLPGWALRFHKLSKDGSGKCNIVPGGDGVHLAIFDISPADKAVLDAIEGVGSGYLSRDLDVPGVGPCAAYVAQASHVDDSLLPYDWYRQLVLLGAQANGFPSSYVDGIRAVPGRADPDRRRVALNRRLIEAIGNAPALTDGQAMP